MRQANRLVIDQRCPLPGRAFWPPDNIADRGFLPGSKPRWIRLGPNPDKEEERTVQEPQRPQLLPDGTLGICRDWLGYRASTSPTRLLIPHVAVSSKTAAERSRRDSSRAAIGAIPSQSPRTAIPPAA